MRDPDLENKIGSDEQKQKTLAFDLYTNIHPQNLQKYIHIPYSEHTEHDPYIHEFLHTFSFKGSYPYLLQLDDFSRLCGCSE